MISLSFFFIIFSNFSFLISTFGIYLLESFSYKNTSLLPMMYTVSSPSNYLDLSCNIIVN